MMTSNRDKRRDLEHLSSLYDTALSRQKTLLDKFNKGKFKSTQISDDHLHALIRGDLKILEERKQGIEKDLASLSTSNGVSHEDTFSDAGDQ